MLYEYEGLDEMEGFDEFGEFEDFDGLDEFEFEESIKSLKPKPPVAKEVLKAAKVAARAGGGTKAAQKVKPTASSEYEFGGDFEDEMEGELEAELESAGVDMELLGEVSALAEMIAEAETLEEAEQFWGMLASAAVPLIGNVVSSLLKESEGSWEMEDEYSLEWEDDGFNDYEGDEFWGALASLAAPLVKKAIPVIGKGIRALGKFAFSRGKRFVNRTARTLPATLARTGVSLARQARMGRPMNVSNIAGTFGNQIWRTMSQPGYRGAIRLNQRLGRYGLGSYPSYPRRRRHPRRRRYPRAQVPGYGGYGRRRYNYGYR